MRNTRPFMRPSPAPSDRLNRSRATARSASASCPSGRRTAVRTGLCSFSRVQIQHGICGTFAVHPRVALFPCGGVSLGLMVDARQPLQRAVQPLSDLFTEVRVNVQVVGSMRFALALGAHVPLLQWRVFDYYYAPPVAGSAALTMGWAFE